MVISRQVSIPLGPLAKLRYSYTPKIQQFSYAVEHQVTLPTSGLLYDRWASTLTGGQEEMPVHIVTTNIRLDQ